MNVKVSVNENRDIIPGVEGIKLNKEDSIIQNTTTALQMLTMD